MLIQYGPNTFGGANSVASRQYVFSSAFLVHLLSHFCGL